LEQTEGVGMAEGFHTRVDGVNCGYERERRVVQPRPN
jgi:hypothetical protein